jgi:hypothetical protein
VILYREKEFYVMKTAKKIEKKMPIFEPFFQHWERAAFSKSAASICIYQKNFKFSRSDAMNK